MPFPYQPSNEQDPNLFPINDPFGLRANIIPLFIRDENSGVVNGLGTAFRIDPWGRYLTAYHVLEHPKLPILYNSEQLGRIFGFFSPGLVYGKPPIPHECFVSLKEIATFKGTKESPMPYEPDEAVNIFDCAKLIFDHNNIKVQEHREFLPLEVHGGEMPKIGDRVMAVGYPGVMNVVNEPQKNLVTFTENLQGAIGRITKLHPKGRVGKAWPSFEVSCKWPSGISGGPIFNEDGKVIGIVSSSFYNPKLDEVSQGYSFWFRPILTMRNFLPSIDTDNSGNIKVWAILKENPWEIKGIAASKKQAEQMHKSLGNNYSVAYGSYMPNTDNFIFMNSIV